MSDGRATGERVIAAGGGAQIFDRGYRSYDGERRSPNGAMSTLTLAALQRVLGLRRPARAKVLPVATILIAYLPAIVMIGMISLLPDSIKGEVPTYVDYYGFVVSAIILFAAFVAPEALCPDRRQNLLGVYLASPLTRARYVLAKLGAVLAVLSVVTVGPLVLMLVVRTLLDVGPALVDLPVLALRIVGGGLMLSLYYASMSLAISSFTNRKGFASTGFVLTMIVSQTVAGVLGHSASGKAKVGTLVSITDAPFELVRRIYGAQGEIDAPIWLVAVVVVGTILVSLATVFVQYHRIEVTR